jgi:predicted DNA-binding protein YlxM (UPF0122 family)
MINSKPQPDFDSHSAEELREILCQLLPSLEKLIPVALEFCGQNTELSMPKLCESCPERKTCSGQCKKLQEQLPKAKSGRGHHENLTRFYEETLEDIRKLRRQDVFNRYEACKHLLTDEQWIAVYLHFKKGLSHVQAARYMGRGRSTVSELLQRAKNCMEEHHKKLREEKYLYLKKEISE